MAATYLEGLRTSDRVTGGATAGLIAGVVMGLLAMLRSGLGELGFWTPIQAIAATFYGPAALNGGLGVILVGLITHLFVAAVWGVVFASLFGRVESRGASVLIGLLFSIIIWAFMNFLIVPIFDPTMATYAEVYSGSWFVSHLVYGALLGLTPGFEKSWARSQGRTPILRHDRMDVPSRA